MSERLISLEAQVAAKRECDNQNFFLLIKSDPLNCCEKVNFTNVFNLKSCKTTIILMKLAEFAD